MLQYTTIELSLNVSIKMLDGGGYLGLLEQRNKRPYKVSEIIKVGKVVLVT